MLSLQGRGPDRSGDERWAAFLDASREDAERKLAALSADDRMRAEEMLHLVRRLEALRPVEPPTDFLRRLETTLRASARPRPAAGLGMRRWALALGAGVAVAGAWAYWRRGRARRDQPRHPVTILPTQLF